MAPETLDAENRWTCPGCREAVQATRTHGIWALPEVLVIYLKRFVHPTLHSFQKVTDLVDFPLTVRATGLALASTAAAIVATACPDVTAEKPQHRPHLLRAAASALVAWAWKPREHSKKSAWRTAPSARRVPGNH